MDSLDFEDLADFLTGDTGDEPLIAFAKKYRIAPEKARMLVKDLLPLCAVARDKKNGQMCKGFATTEGWICKVPVIIPRVGQ